MRQGALVEQGSHEELLQIDGGVYHGLVYAQELAMETDEDGLSAVDLQKTKTTETVKDDVIESEENRPPLNDDLEWKNKSFLASGGRMIAEQRHHSVLYFFAFLGILGAGAVYPIQAYVFAVCMIWRNSGS